MRLIAACVVLLTATPMAAAQAADEASAEAEPETLGPRGALSGSPRTLYGERLGVWLEAGFSGGGRGDERAEFVASPEFGLRLRAGDGVVLDASWGLSVAATSVEGEVSIGGEMVRFRGRPTRIDPGNPVLQLLYSGAVASNVHLEVGVGAGVPTAARSQVGSDNPTLSERSASQVSHRAAMAMRGYWSPWRWAPERFALFVPARVAASFGELALDFDLALGVMVPVLGGRGVDADVIVQLGAGVGGQVAEPLFLGVRLRGVGAPLGVIVPGVDPEGSDASDRVVFSAEPWVRLSVDPVQLSLRAVVTLNGADGVAGERAPAVAAFLGVGAEVD